MNDMVTRLKDAIEHLKLSPNAFATKAKIDPSNFNKMLEGKQNITEKTISKLCHAHNLSADWLRYGHGDMMDAATIKGNISSSGSIYAEGSEVIVGSPVLHERVKYLKQTISNLEEEKKGWDSERESLKREISLLRAKNEELNKELSKTKDKLIEHLMNSLNES